MVLEKAGRENFILATKSMKRDYDGILEELNISLKNLRTSYIDLSNSTTSVSFEELDQIFSGEGVPKAIKEAKEKGLVRGNWDYQP